MVKWFWNWWRSDEMFLFWKLTWCWSSVLYFYFEKNLDFILTFMFLNKQLLIQLIANKNKKYEMKGRGELSIKWWNENKKNLNGLKAQTNKNQRGWNQEV